MSILVGRGTRVVVQGITGRDGAFHTQQMLAYGTKVVAGVTPGRGGEEVHGVPVFDGVIDAVRATKANTSVIYVPAPFAADAVYEAADAGLALIVCITEGIPVRDTLRLFHELAQRRAATGKPRLIGPNCPGLISPPLAKVGILPGHICRPGPVGVVSRSGTLTYEVVQQLTLARLGQSTCVGIGGDPIVGTSFVDCLELFERDAQTESVVLIGEIGGSDEEEAALFVKRHMSKPVVAFVAGQSAPEGRRMGHAGAIVSGGAGTAAGKIAAFEAAGVPVARIPSEIPGLVEQARERWRRRARRSASVPARRARISRAARGRPAGSMAGRATSRRKRAVAAHRSRRSDRAGTRGRR